MTGWSSPPNSPLPAALHPSPALFSTAWEETVLVAVAPEQPGTLDHPPSTRLCCWFRIGASCRLQNQEGGEMDGAAGGPATGFQYAAWASSPASSLASPGPPGGRFCLLWGLPRIVAVMRKAENNHP